MNGRTPEGRIIVRDDHDWHVAFRGRGSAPQVTLTSDDGGTCYVPGDEPVYMTLPAEEPAPRKFGTPTEAFAVSLWTLEPGERVFIPDPGAERVCSLETMEEPGAWWTVTAQPYDGSAWRAHCQRGK